MIFYEGVALPIGSEVYHEDSSGRIITHYLVKLFREEFSGISDLGYAEGDLHVSSWPDYNPDIQVDLYEATSWFKPRKVLPLNPKWVAQFSPMDIIDSDSTLNKVIKEKREDRGLW